jgi:hypothetical protein
VHLVELLSWSEDRVWQIHDVEDLGAAEAGDLHGTHALRLGLDQWRTGPGTGRVGRSTGRIELLRSLLARCRMALAGTAAFREHVRFRRVTAG